MNRFVLILNGCLTIDRIETLKCQSQLKIKFHRIFEKINGESVTCSLYLIIKSYGTGLHIDYICIQFKTDFNFVVACIFFSGSSDQVYISINILETMTR